ncbi:MAG: IS110 family transposase [Acidobacteria bacterium]|nr:IS110 family transposase [Acidobacteriota bacterium]
MGKTSSQVCILTEDGELIEQRIKTERGSFSKLLATRTPARILIEASTESEWVACCLQAMGHEVIVADPNFAPMYATRTKRIKTDRRDARALCEACRLGAYRSAYRTSEEQRHVRAQLAVRETMVNTRTKYINLVRSLLRREGWRIASGTSATFSLRVEQLPLPDHLQGEIAPLLALLQTLNEHIKQADQQLEQLVKADQVVARLCTRPGVGRVTAAAFKAVVDDHARFENAKRVRSYLGLVPSEQSSGERQRRGRISKAGHKRVRYLLVEVAWAILLKKQSLKNQELRLWAERIAARRGRQVAAVALARKLAGIWFALWRDGTTYTPQKAQLKSRP